MKKRIATVLAAILAAGSLPVNAFSDVPEELSSAGAIEYLYNLGIVSGVDGENFMPEANIKRADFAIILAKALGLEAVSENKFSDVRKEAYYSEAVNSAANASILSGVGDGLFNPESPISVQEAASVLTRACEMLTGKKINYANILKSLTDGEETATWAKTAVNKALTMGFVEPENGKIYPTSYISRAKMAEGVAKLIQSARETTDWDYSKSSELVHTKRGNIFKKGEKAEIGLVTEYPIVECVVKNFWNEEVYSEFKRVANGELMLDFSDFEAGYYLVEFYGTDPTGITSVIAKTTFCILEECDYSRIEDSPYGMNLHCARGTTGWSYDLIDEASYIGVKNLRDGTEWAVTEKQKGVYNDECYRTLLEYCDKYNMELLTVTGFTNKFYDNGATPYTPEGRQGYANYSKALHDMCGTELKQEMYNEWWGKQFGDRGDGPADSLPETYVPLVENIYKTVKEAYPDAILLGEFGGEAWNQSLLDLGIAPYMDAAAYHQYANWNRGGPEAGIRTLARNLIKVFKPLGKDVLLTETGQSTSTNSYGAPEAVQAYLVPAIHSMVFSEGVTEVYWYDLIDDGNVASNHEHRFGILHAFGSEYGSYTPKPAYAAYGAMTRIMKDKKFARNEAKDGVEIFTYEGNGEETHVVYALENLKNITVYADEPVIVSDLMGRSTKYTPKDGKLYFTASDESIYITGKINGFDVTSPVDLIAPETSYTGENFAIQVTGTDVGETFVSEKSSANTDSQIAIKAGRSTGERRIVAEIENNNNKYARLVKPVEIIEGYEVAIFSGMNGEEGAMNVKVKNNSENPLLVSGLDWYFEKDSGELTVNKTIPGKSEDYINIGVGKIKDSTAYNAQVQMIIDGEASGRIDAAADIEFNLLHPKTVTVDGIKDELPDEWKIDLTDGSITSLAMDGSNFGGNDDLSGFAWVTYDDENLYMTADIKDDFPEGNELGETIWRSDSIQFALYCPDNENYDTLTKYFEIGLARNETEGNQFWLWRSIYQPIDNKYLPGYKFETTREDKHTLYELSIPWESLKIDPKKEKNIALTILVNDGDKGVRQTALSWGEGVATGKNPLLFRSFVIMEGGVSDE